jgi:hypothetical protein
VTPLGSGPPPDDPPRHRLTLYVGVRWFGSDGPGRLDIDVEIDGVPVTTGQRFPTPEARKSPDDFSVELSDGGHRLRARSASRNAAFEVGFETAGKPRYAELCYDHYPKEHPDKSREGFSFTIQDRDFGWR